MTEVSGRGGTVDELLEAAMSAHSAVVGAQDAAAAAVGRRRDAFAAVLAAGGWGIQTELAARVGLSQSRVRAIATTLTASSATTKGHPGDEHHHDRPAT